MRLVARDFKAYSPDMEGVFTCSSIPCTGRLIDFYAVKNNFSVLIGDAVCAYFNAVQDEEVLCECPPEFLTWILGPDDHRDMVMILDKKLYGERTASIRFDEFFAGVLKEKGFERCPEQPQFYINRETRIALERHQDDVHAAEPTGT